ncbi:clasp N terminal-domain-containing protein [Amylocystis lapponica]|nr:clasp N terminal-domain-containing protein [Amylocystis lapponica]
MATDESTVDRLIAQCRANDIDARVDAITKLQAEFEAGAEIPDTDALIAALKTCLRTPNQHLTTATLSALPPLLPLIISSPLASASTPATPASPAGSTSSVRATALIDAHTLRVVLLAFLPTGGVIDRLGDSREKAREKARETLVVLGGLAFRSGGGSVVGRSRDGKGAETPLQVFEKYLRENALASKVWRVREQAILTLVHIRRVHHLFPLRPYLPALVEALEDTDGVVRECARGSVVELFTGPGVTDAARADLKKEMGKKGVRKAIVDGVLAKLLAGGHGGGSSTPGTLSEAGSENGEYVPPSIALMNRKPSASAANGSAGSVARMVSHGNSKEAPRPPSRAAVTSPVPTDGAGTAGGGTDVKPVYIASVRDLEHEFGSMLKHFEVCFFMVIRFVVDGNWNIIKGKESEHNWAAREKAVQRVRGMLKGSVHERYPEQFLFGLKNGFIDASLKTLASLRTTVASNTCSLYSELAIAFGTSLDQFCDVMLTNLLRMSSLTKKIIAQQSQTVVTTFLSHTSAQPRLILPQLWNILQDRAMQTRAYAVGHVKTYLEVHCARSKHAIEAVGGAEILDKCVRKALGDPHAGVRDNARQCFWTFESIWSERGRAILESLDPIPRKQLEKVCPDPDAIATMQPAPVTPKMKKSSVAAAIAASRAKAKAIATAPPTLRHQATSTSHATRATSPPTRRTVSPSLSSSSSTGAIQATSTSTRSSPPRSRIVSGPLSRSVSSGVVPISHHLPASPPSPTPDPTTRRRISSPLVIPPSSPPSAFRQAIQTALPVSPPPSVTSPVSPTRPGAARTGLQAAIPVQRNSFTIAGLNQMAGSEEESLLLASKIPIPEDSDSDMDESVNPISFSAAYETYNAGPKAHSQAASFSPQSSSSKPGLPNAVSTTTSSPPAGVPQPIVEDAMRARAEQAESAAERLLELVEPEEDAAHPSMPPSLLLRNGTTTANQKTKSVAGPGSSKAAQAPPRTPINKNAAIMRRAALFQDSPAQNGKSTTLFDIVDGRDIASEWWGKRTSLVADRTPLREQDIADCVRELQDHISALEQGLADVLVLKKLALLCSQTRVPADEPTSPLSPAFSVPLTPSPLIGSSGNSSSLASDIWSQNKNFDRLLSALLEFLDSKKNTDELEYGLIVLWEMLENQVPLLEGREADIFSTLLHIRYCAQTAVMQATNMFRDALTSRIGPVYGLTTLHASLRSFRGTPVPATSSAEVRDGTYAFGLIAMGKFILRLPAEVLEEELPRLRATLISALTDASSESSLMVREAAAASIIAAQLVLRDETHLFALLDGLPDDKKNLLTYLFDKHGSRGAVETSGSSGMEKLEKEMRRLDNRTSTPPRSSIQSAFVSM